MVKFLYLAVFCLMIGLGGCSHGVAADLSSYESEQIVVLGVSEEPLAVTAGDLAALKCTKKTVRSRSGKKDVAVRACGPTLDTFLESLGVEWEQLEGIVFTASDGYTKEFSSDFFLVHPEVVLAVADGKEPLKEEDRPVRLVISGTTPDFWVRQVTEIRIERKES